MTDTLARQLSRLDDCDSAMLRIACNRGIERETLRVRPDATLAVSGHPQALGSKLCHPSITTDFSEVQPELITPVTQQVSATLDCLDEIHRYVDAILDGELLWAASMPCTLGGEGEIPLAYYGDSNLGRLKTTYRNGLGYRYGRIMQTICAVHYNFSLSREFWEAHRRDAGGDDSPDEFRSRRYFDLMRNFRRYSWLPIYLFGASPAVCGSFVSGRQHQLQRFDADSYYAPFATSLRNGDLGYQSTVQATELQICYNSLENYVDTLLQAVLTPYDPYVAIGERDGAGHRQVNTHLLQSEAEFYTTVRAKCLPPPGANFLHHLRSQGVEYIEIRLLDVNPYLPLGIDAAQIHFLDTLLLYCLLAPSPEHDDALCTAVRNNVRDTVYRGRDPDLGLDDGGRRRFLREWAGSLLRELEPVARFLDRLSLDTAHADSLALQRARLEDPGLTPSAQVLQDMTRNRQSHTGFALEQTLRHRQDFRSRPLPEVRMAHYRDLARQSFQEQAALEQADAMDFDSYLEQRMQGYYSLQHAN